MEEKDDTLWVREEQDISSAIEENKKSYNLVSHKGYKSALRKKNMWKAASIPNIIVEKWKRELNVDVFNDEDWPKVRKLLNDPEYQFLRTSPGKV